MILSVAPPYLQLAPRWFRGTVRTEGGPLLTGIFRGSLLLSTPGQPSLIMPASALCLIIGPNRVIASRFCHDRPVTGFIAHRGYLLRVVAHTARMLVCPGGCPYCWYALFKEQRGAISHTPHSPSRIIMGWIKKIQKNFFIIPIDIVCKWVYDAPVESKQIYERSGLQCLKSILIWRSFVVECIPPGHIRMAGCIRIHFLHLKHDFSKGIS